MNFSLRKRVGTPSIGRLLPGLDEIAISRCQRPIGR